MFAFDQKSIREEERFFLLLFLGLGKVYERMKREKLCSFGILRCGENHINSVCMRVVKDVC